MPAASKQKYPAVLAVRLNQADKLRLVARAGRQARTASAVIRRLVEDYLDGAVDFVQNHCGPDGSRTRRAAALEREKETQ